MRPFTDERHDELRARVARFAQEPRPPGDDGAPARALAGAGLLELAVPGEHGGALAAISPLALVVAREALASPGSHCPRCAGVPARAMGIAASVCTASAASHSAL